MRLLDFKRRLVIHSHYQDLLVGCLMKCGLKYKAFKVVAAFFSKLQLLSRLSVEKFFCMTLSRYRPLILFVLRKVGSKVYMLPSPLRKDSGHSTIVRWFVQSALARTEKGLVLKLYCEFVDLCSAVGRTHRKFTDYYGIAQTNRPFLRYLRKRSRRQRFRIRRLK